jgi:hypothetical protein
MPSGWYGLCSVFLAGKRHVHGSTNANPVLESVMQLNFVQRVGTIWPALLIGAALGGGSLPTYAFDLDSAPNSTRILSYPAYLPSARQFVGISSYSFSTDNGQVTDSLGITRYRFHSDGHGPAQVFLYGLTQDLTIDLAATSVRSTTHYDFSSGASSTHQTSFLQPQIGITYRWLDQENHPFNLDTSALAPGRLIVALSRQMQDLTVSASSGAYLTKSDNGFDEVRGVDVSTSQFWGYFAGLQTQTRLTPDLSLDLGAQYNSSNVDAVHASIGNAPFAINYPHGIRLGSAINYHLVRNRWVARVEYDYVFLSTRRDTYADPASDLQSTARDLRSIDISMIYSF